MAADGRIPRAAGANSRLAGARRLTALDPYSVRFQGKQEAVGISGSDEQVAAVEIQTNGVAAPDMEGDRAAAEADSPASEAPPPVGIRVARRTLARGTLRRQMGQ